MGTPPNTYGTLGDLPSPTADGSTGFELASSPRQVSFATENLQPPSNVYVQPEDLVRIVVLNSDPNVSEVDVQLRVLTPDGQVKLDVLSVINVTSDRVENFAFYHLSEGFILSAAIAITAIVGAPLPFRGRTFVSVVLARTTLTPSVVTEQLISDYVSKGHNPAWPVGQYVSSVEGPGWIHNVAVANPAAGAGWSLTVPTGARWKVHAIFEKLVTSAAVLNRRPSFLILDNLSNSLYTVSGFVQQPASQNVNWCGAPGVQGNTTLASQNVIPLPNDFILQPGWQIQGFSDALDPADQFSLIQVLVEEWLT